MKTEWWRKTKTADEQEALRRAGQIIREGGLVAFPTETVYGLGGDAFNPGSSKKIYAAKGRPSDNPLIVHICRLSDLEKAARDIPEAAYRLAEAFWPGPLTMILKKQPDLPKETTGGLDTVAVRFPDHSLAQGLIDAAGGFVAAPSANLSGRPSPTEGKYVYEDLTGRIEMLIDDGRSSLGLESTIVDLTGEVPMILRPGFITPKMLQKVLPEVILDPALLPDLEADVSDRSESAVQQEKEDAQEGLAPKAPGMKYKHYAPKGIVTILKGEGDTLCRYLYDILKKDKKNGKKTGLILSQDTADELAALIEAEEKREAAADNSAAALRRLADSVKLTKGAVSAEESAHSLFAFLREFDDEGIEVIYAQAVPESDLGLAVMNRLKKAAGGRIVDVDSVL